MSANPFLQAVLDEPEDDLARLVYADWLDEQGDPRGEFIRVQVELAALTPADDSWRDLKNRETELLNRHLAEWFDGMRRVRHGFSHCQYQPFFAGKGSCQLVRGFRESVRVRTRVFLKHAAKIFEQMPLRRLHLFYDDHGEKEFQRFAKSPYLEKLTELTFDWQGSVEPQLRAILAHPHSQSLQSLELRNTSLAEVVGPLQKANDLTHLRRLTINARSYYIPRERPLLQIKAVKQFAKCQIPRLEHLAMTGFATETEILKRLLNRTPWQETVKSWDWSGHDFDDDGMEFLTSLGTSSQWTELRLGGQNQPAIQPAARAITGRGMQSLAAADFSSLKVLDVSSQKVGSGKLRTLLKNPTLTNLEELDLSFNRLRDTGAAVLAKSKVLGQLKTLRVNQCEIRETGLESLMNSDCLRSLRRLFIGGNPVGREAIQKIVDSALMPQLKTLYLSRIPRQNQTQFKCLGKSDAVSGLAELDLSGQPLQKKSLLALASSPQLHDLAHLHWGVGNAARPAELLEIAEDRWPGRCRF
ncbi:TIGR02996 domain-containing protein [Thalassoroseus pseudoceratinae]|uniref:TIGR02996 domain-containing protein n=1 Tax=Thalassoroseus pseudoceratinae TaxID=2713176 RepID=UPI00142016BE|nr:TIGR02996 domain-containing protein [Thalassoroseus pseudoceratinae]